MIFVIVKKKTTFKLYLLIKHLIYKMAVKCEKSPSSSPKAPCNILKLQIPKPKVNKFTITQIKGGNLFTFEKLEPVNFCHCCLRKEKNF